MFVRRRKFGRRQAPPPIGSLFMVTFMLFILLIILSFWVIDKGIRPTLMDIAEQKTTEFATRGINAAVKFAENLSFEDIAQTKIDKDGNISIVGWNPTIVNKINRAATDRVEEFFHSMNRGEPPHYEDPLGEPTIYGDTVDELVDRDPTVVEIPIGQALGNSILANLGPKIPVNLELVGAVRTDIIDKWEDFGINNVMITLYVYVEADVQIIVPFTSKLKTVSTKIMIDKHLVMGSVPNFYGGGGQGPSIAVPKDEFSDLQDD